MMRWPRTGGSLRPEKSGPVNCAFQQWNLYPLGGSLKRRHGGREAVAELVDAALGFDPQHIINQVER